ncbi:helix-turn-helix transcriptional regulator [Lentzea sp. BCCO 10_0856]|uniref:Helix-turn-helix transcriptional regulator n=1 Tax=Lentzea miocenica TaxID=3095431 RepID=A0ABU4TE78_9PSEU|nr:helix-turn-helix transcriptional regulator [Lentzea sp. BCCO 10_0856]MDX8036486.1 helix-turn-helix transcriptional regulator [Lentzea sp. BCCO 10_0856]
MSRAAATSTSGQGSRSTGVVSGFVLKLARQAAGLTQERLAEALPVDVTTVQGWESGRRPLAAMNAGDFLRLTSRLTRLGAPASTRRHLTEAIEADQVLSTAITAGSTIVDADCHPLSASVHRRTTTNLITWPITGTLPHQLREFTPKVPRRGPVALHPTLSVEQRSQFFDHLIAIAEQGTSSEEALLRRQAVYLLGFDGRPQVVNWLRDEWRRAGRRIVRDGDVTGLLEARSASVALASAGEPTQIHDFVERTADSHAEVANLNYWAYWIGDLSDEQTNDAFMLIDDTRSWTGARLLTHLMDRLAPESAHLPLNLHTLHALVASRPMLLTSRAGVRKRLDDVLDRLASSGNLTNAGRDQVAGLRYALRIADR